MNQPTDSLGRGLVYRNSLDCLLQTVRGEGFWGKNRFWDKSAILNFTALPAVWNPELNSSNTCV
jgi:hypothetical protein